MPTYTYKREDGTTFDVQQSMSEYEPLDVCPETGQRCHRVYQTPGVTFLGAGWPGIEANDEYTTFTHDENGIPVRKE